VDRKFLADVEEKSAADKEELAARVSAQTEELGAIKDTVGILTSEESRAHFEKTKPASFLQVAIKAASNSKTLEERRERVVDVLRRVNSPELSLLATRAQLAAFDEVKKMISDLIKDLKAKKAAEIEKRDYCISEFDTNKKESDDTSFLIEDLGAAVEELEAKSKALAEAIETTKSNQKKLKLSIATATTIRAESSSEYQQLYQDFLTTKDILNKCIVRLNEFYGKKSFLTVSQEPAPVGLKKGGYKKKNGGGVIGMIRMIIEDSKKTAVEAQSDEAAAQASYEKSMADAVTETATLKAALISQSEEKADTDSEAEQKKSDQQDALQKLQDLQATKKALHGECDFLMANFDNRQAGFSQEAEALQQAIEILSGAQ
jgi:chromosome segregation ATPase